MHTVLTISELLQRIVLFSDDKTSLLSLAQTCREISGAALDQLWSHLDSILPLLKLLGRLVTKSLTVYNSRGRVQSETTTWEYTNPYISRDQWETYKKYGTRVKSIVLSEGAVSLGGGSSQSFHISPEVFRVIGLTQPREMCLLPNLRNVKLSPTYDSIIQWFPFLQQSNCQVEVTVKITNEDTNLLFYVLRELALRLPRITILHIVSNVPVSALQAGTTGCLSDMSHLRQITLPPYYLTPSALTALAILPHLEVISCNFQNPEVAAPNTVAFRRSAEERLRKLTKLALTLPTRHLFPLLKSRNWAPELTDIEISSPEVAADTLKDFTLFVSQHRAHITALRLDLRPLRRSNTLEQIKFQHLLPLLGCRKLQTFVLHHPIPCPIDDGDVEEMLRHWPDLTEINIGINPTSLEPSEHVPTFRFDILNTFAQLCPSIEAVGFLFRGDCALTWQSNLYLPKIREFHVGWVSPDDPCEAALYFSSICNAGVEFVACKNPFRALPPNQGTLDVWKEVKKQFRMFGRNKERILSGLREMERCRSTGWHMVTRVKQVDVELEGLSGSSVKKAASDED